MSAVRPIRAIRRIVALVAAAILAAPAGSVGLGPLTKDGIVDGPAKAFYLDLINPYQVASEFVLSPIGAEDEAPAGNVRVLPDRVTLGGQKVRRVLVIADHLTPGVVTRFRVCAERATDPVGETIHARVCSKLSVRRIVPAPHAVG